MIFRGPTRLPPTAVHDAAAAGDEITEDTAIHATFSDVDPLGSTAIHDGPERAFDADPFASTAVLDPNASS